MKKLFLFIFLFFSIYSFTQEIEVIDKKGTIKTIDNSKWTLSGTDIYNKNTGNVGIGTSAPNNLLEIKGITNSTISGLRLTGLGSVIPTAPLSNVLSVDTNGDVVVTTNPASSNWLTSGNANALNTSFLGTTNDIKMNIGSNNTSILEFGQRNTLGLTQSYADYTNPNQYMVHVKGDGTSALQFEATNASFYKPLFFTTTDGNFRLKGSAAGTDFFELGSAGASNNGSFEFLIGDDGDEPITFKKFNYTTLSFIEMMRMQGTGLNSEVRVGVNSNGAVANSTFQVNGSVSNSILQTTGNLTLTENHHTIILGGNHTITLPGANTCSGRIYMIKNPSPTVATTISTYRDIAGITSTSIAASTGVWIQSDGTNWQQVNNKAVSSSLNNWNLTGNTITASDFIGGNNYASLFLKVNAAQIGAFHPLGGITLGRSAISDDNQGISIGENTVSSQQASAFGYGASASGFQSNAIGFGSSATNNSATAIGFNSTASGQNSTAIGHSATTSQANAVVIGNTTDDATFAGTKIGLGTATPTRRLHVEGGFRLVDGTQGLNKVLTSDATGNASWQNLTYPQILVVANRTTTYTPNTTSFATLIYNTAATNIGSSYNLGTGTFTAPETGLYEVHVHNSYRSTNNSANMVELQIVVNGVVDLRLATSIQNNNITNTISGSTLVSLNSGQTIQIQVGNRVSNLTPQVGTGQHNLKIIRLK